MLTRLSKIRNVEVLLGCALLTQLQWLFGNIYEEILTPNSIAASVQALDAYNVFFRYSKPCYYYIPFTHLGCLVIWLLAVSRHIPFAVKAPLRTPPFLG